jgi:hypothetical protein
MPVLKLAGGSTGTRKSSAKPTSTRKPAAKATASKRSPGRPPKAKTTTAKATASSNGRTRRPVTDDDRVINRHIKALTKAGDMRAEAEEAHQAAVEEMYVATRAAMEDGVPTGVIIEHAGITRQWLYNMGKHRDRDNGNGRKSKSTASKRVSKPTTSNRRSAPTASSAPKRPRIRTAG